MDSPESSTFSEFLSRFAQKRIAIATHNRADVDAISSAFALSKILPNSTICTNEEMSEGAKQLTERLMIPVSDLAALEKSQFEGLVVCDTSAYTLLPAAKDWKILLIIDHHRSDGRVMKSDMLIVDESSPSCAEIIANLVPKEKIDKSAAFGLCVGMIADGARFKSARMETFQTLAKMMEIAGASYSELLGYAEPEPKMEAKLAILKAMKKVDYIYAAGYVIATTETDSNESDSASLISEAADVAFVAKWKDFEKETRISARARKSVLVPLNKVMSEVGKALGGAGGGHPKAAGAALKAHTDEALKKCVETFILFAEK